jgi:O-antigen/teichoic acid export membrane protein
VRVESLSDRVVGAGLWVVGAKLGARLLAAVRVLALARLLTPHDFGVVALATLPLSALGAWGGISSPASLIHRQERSRALLDTAWTLGLIRRTLAAAVLLLGAPAIAAFFDSADATAVIRAMALLPLLQGVRNIGVVEFQQELRFGQETLLDAVGRVVETVVAIGLALWLWNAWALVGGALVGEAAATAMTYLRHPYRPRARLVRREVANLVGYGRWIVGSRLIEWAVVNGVQALIGRALGTSALGVFQMAERVTQLPISHLPRMAAHVTLSAFAKLQSDPIRVRAAYLRVLALVALVSCPAAALLGGYGESIVRVVLGARWTEAGPIVQILALYGVFRCVASTVVPLFQGVGRPALQMVVVASELVAVAALVGPLLHRGTAGAAAVVAIGGGVAMIVALALATRVLRLGTGDLGRTLGAPGLAALVALAAAVWLGGAPATMIGLAGALVVSLGVYAVTLLGLIRLGAYPLDPQVRAFVTRWLPRLA